MAKILAFAGSLRAGSFNKKLIQVAAEGAKAAGAEVTLVDLRDYPLPLFDADLEERDGMPGPARNLKRLFVDADGVLISSPEYNSSMPGIFKNAIDWVSRSESDDEPPLVAFRGKAVGLVSASPGALGGQRALVAIRMMFGNLGMYVVPETFSLSKADAAFDEKGGLKDAKQKASAEKVGASVARLAAKLAIR